MISCRTSICTRIFDIQILGIDFYAIIEQPTSLEDF